MKGKVKLYSTKNPEEGLDVIRYITDRYYVCTIEKHHKNFGLFDLKIKDNPHNNGIGGCELSELQQLVIEYDDIAPSSAYPIIHKSLRILPQQWDWALAFLYSEVDFEEFNTPDGKVAKIQTATPVRTIEDIPEELRHMYKLIKVSNNPLVNQYFQERFSIPHNHEFVTALEDYDTFLKDKKFVIVDEEKLKKIATDFFYKWYNSPGNNTLQGWDDWWSKNKSKYV
jgi:hypothetical protein